MSGPKTSKYTLTAEQRKLIRQQLEMERRTKEEHSKIKNYITNLRVRCNEFESSLDCAKDLNNRTGNGEEFIHLVRKFRDDINSVIDENIQKQNNTTLPNIEKQRQTLEKKTVEFDKQFLMLNELAKGIKLQLDNEITQGIDKGFFRANPIVIKKTESIEITELAAIMLKKLSQMGENHTLTQEMYNEFNKAIETIKDITDINYLKNFQIVTFSEIIKKYDRYLSEYEENKKKFDEVMSYYGSLCEMMAIGAKPFSFSKDVIEKIQVEISDLENQLLQEREETYISDCLDDIMVDMGYDFLGDRTVTKKSGKKFRNELHAFNDGTVVNVTFASDGKITMELGGVDKTDRLPTIGEASRICEDMKSFCCDYEVIEKKLEDKGIILKNRVSILPPNPEYAQVINISDYNVSNDDFDVNRDEAKRKKGNVRKKKIHME